MIGTILKRGLSGGEKRRTTVGQELVVRQAMAFLGESRSVHLILQVYVPEVRARTDTAVRLSFFFCASLHQLLSFHRLSDG